MKKIILVSFLIFALILSGCVEPPVTPPVEPPIEPPVIPPVEPPVEKSSWGFGSTNPIQGSNYWWCSDNVHLTNGVTTIECVGKCATVDGRDRCIDPLIPPFGTQRTYECVNENWIAISENGETHYYYCQAGCEVMADGTTMCWCGTDPDCGKPDNFPGGVGKGTAGAWHCTDYWHFSNGKETVFCELGCIADICYHPEIPESMPPCCYECIGTQRMAVTCDGVTNEYDCVNDCENRGECIDICYCDSDDDCLNPDPKTDTQGNTVNIISPDPGDAGNDNGTEEDNPPAEVCGDAECNGDETCSTCAEDCGECESICGDDLCNGAEDETSCPEDCGIAMDDLGTA
ncbi:MAG: hypothetical protein V1672_03960 [Candidatus Diapherotrites archaeon]